MRRKLKESTAAGDLLLLRQRLRRQGKESYILNLRLQSNELAQVRDQYLAKMIDQERIYPHFLPTQASGRWSTTEPPVTNFPNNIRDCLIPDEGEIWICFDYDAIEAKIVAAVVHDKEDLKAFSENYDIHTLTACKMVGLPYPPVLTKELHTHDAAAEWRSVFAWKGSEDKRRIAAKCRYGLLYGKDHKAILGSKYENELLKQGLTQDEILRAAKQFLASKPGFTSARNTWFEKLATTGIARTFLGRRRVLYGDWWARAKDGFNHMIQGTVTDMLNLALIDLHKLGGRLVYPSHDAAKIAFDVTCWNPDNDLLEYCKSIVEKDWTFEGETIRSTASWKVVHGNI